MYATSKLIIPPKPARDTPFIPKLRIRLRHSPNIHCSDRDQSYNVAHNESPHLVENFGDDNSFQTNIGSLVSVCSFSMFRNASQKSSHPNSLTKFNKPSRQRQLSGFTSGCTIRRAARKRKQSSGFVDTLDLENPDSILTKVNLKLLINRETFSSLPLDVQQMLSQLLPLFDHCREMSLNNSVLIDENDYSPSLSLSSGVDSSEQSNTVWLHPTALNNEFFTKALQDFSDRQAKGEFTPRIRNRAGLRAHVGNRYRYASSSDLVQSNANSNQNKTFIHEVHTKKSSGQTNSRRSSRPKTKNFDGNAPDNDFHHHAPVFTNSPPVDASLISSTVSVSASSTKNSQSKRNKSSKFSHLQSDSNNKSMIVCSPSPILPREKFKVKSECFIESNNIEFEDNNQNKTSDLSEPSSLPVGDTVDNGICSSVKSFYPADLENSEFTDAVCCLSDGNRDDHSLPLSPAYNATLASPRSVGDPNKGLKLCDKTLESESNKLTNSPNTKPTHARRLSLDSKLVNPASNRQNSTTSSLRSTRPSRSSNSNSSGGSPSMPPPRQTKTLAAMREKMRAKRMLKESERGTVGQRFYGLPGSMTPHPSSGSSGYFQNRNYSTPINFTPLSETGNKQSPSVSSPSFGNSISPPSNDRTVHSVNVQSETQELTEPNLASGSPYSPHSAPSNNVMSPLVSVNNSYSEGITTNNNNISNLDSYSCYSNSFTQSYPSSPHLPNSNAGIVLQHSLFSQSPSPVHPTKTHRLEQSVSAPPTPSNPQSEQNFTNYLHQPGHSFSSLEPCSSSSAPLHTSQVSPTVSFGSYPSPVFTGKSSVPSSVRPSTSDSSFSQVLNHPVSGSGFPTSSISSVVSEALMLSKSACHSLPTAMEPITCSIQATVKSVPSLDTISISPLTSVSSVTKLLTSSSQQSRSSTTTRAFFVDGDNLSEAVAFLQSLNPKATITQQQFLLIPGANKSQMILCRAPVTCSSEIIPSVSTQTSVSVSQANLTSWVNNVSHMTTSCTSSVEHPPITASASVIPNDVSPSTSVTEKNSTSESTSFGEPFKSNNFYMTQCSSDGSFPKVMKTSELQIPRSLVYSKSINVSSSNGSSFPVNILISHPKSLETSNERTPLLQVVKSVSSSKVAIPSSTNSIPCSSRTTVPTVLNYKQPVTHSQLNVSLLTPGPSVINNEVPILFVQDRNQHPIRSQTPTQPLNWVQRSSFDQHMDLTDRSTISLPILSTATVITTHANNTGEFRCSPHPVARSGPSMQLSNNVSASSHFGLQPIQSVQPSNHTAKSLGSTSFLSGPTATIMSPCLPAVILSHPITIQSTSNIAPCQQNIFNRPLP
ncbi:unnamed protein product [Schistosoma turkestanicum]|nr:unnamed protein product [Schistosoma turkestanicum]